MFKNKVFIAILTLLLTLSVVKPVYAYNLPDFGSCLNPQGSVIASYDSGTHGIVGQNEVSGSDSVYQSSSNGVTQCFCPDNGNGIQTNWLKASDLSADDISILKNQGWIYVPTGSNWGLGDTAYLAKNSDFACRGTRSATKPQVGEVLGLANTGDSAAIYFLIISGAIFLITGMSLRRFSK